MVQMKTLARRKDEPVTRRAARGRRRDGSRSDEGGRSPKTRMENGPRQGRGKRMRGQWLGDALRNGQHKGLRPFHRHKSIVETIAVRFPLRPGLVGPGPGLVVEVVHPQAGPEPLTKGQKEQKSQYPAGVCASTHRTQSYAFCNCISKTGHAAPVISAAPAPTPLFFCGPACIEPGRQRPQ
jgi:hypothetical protein